MQLCCWALYITKPKNFRVLRPALQIASPYGRSGERTAGCGLDSARNEIQNVRSWPKPLVCFRQIQNHANTRRLIKTQTPPSGVLSFFDLLQAGRLQQRRNPPQSALDGRICAGLLGNLQFDPRRKSTRLHCHLDGFAGCNSYPRMPLILSFPFFVETSDIAFRVRANRMTAKKRGNVNWKCFRSGNLSAPLYLS